MFGLKMFKALASASIQRFGGQLSSDARELLQHVAATPVEALDERTYTMEPGMILISADSGPESLGGVMGGERRYCSASERTHSNLSGSISWSTLTTRRG